MRGEMGQGPEAPSPPAAAAPSGAARSPGSAWSPPAAAAAAPPASASSGPPVGGGSSEVGGSTSGPVPYSLQSLKLTRPLAKLPTGMAFLPAWPCRHHHAAGPARPPRLWSWPLVAPTRSHRQGPPGVGPACVAGGRRSCLDGAELLWGEPQARLTVTIKTRSMDGAHTACPDPRNSQMREAVPLLFHKQDVNLRETKRLKVRNSAMGG